MGIIKYFLQKTELLTDQMAVKSLPEVFYHFMHKSSTACCATESTFSLD